MRAVAENPHIEIHQLSVGYGNTILHKDINITILPAEVLVILGRNGSGKSTLLRCVSGLQKSISGNILINGHTITSYNNLELSKNISVVLTGNRRNAGMMRVKEIFSLSRAPHTGIMHNLSGEDILCIHEAISLFELQELENRYLYTLSDGELQKVMIARAYIQETPIVVLDEPSSHLDIFNTADIFASLNNLSKIAHKTLIIATHEMEYGLRIADKVLLLDRDGNHAFHSKEEAIENGALEKYFNSQRMYFDKKQMRFLQREKL